MYKKIIKEIMLSLMIGALFISLTACAGTQGSDTQGSDTQGSDKSYTAKTVRMAAFREDLSLSAEWLVMKDKSFFESAVPSDVSVEWSVIPSSADQRDAIVSGNIDIGGMASSVVLSAFDQGLPIQILSEAPYSDSGMYSDIDSIKSIDDLDSTRKIIVVSALNTHLHLAFQKACLERFGDAHKFDNQMVAMPLADALATLKSSDDAQAVLLAWNPGMQYDGLREILDLTPYYSQFELCPFRATSVKFASENPAIIEAYYAALDKTVAFMDEHPDEAAAILAKYWKNEPVEDIEQMLRDNPPRVEISESGYDKLASFMKEIGLLENEAGKFKDLPNYDSIPKVD